MQRTGSISRRTLLASLAAGTATVLLPRTADASPLKLWAYTKKVAGKVRVIIYSAITFPGLTIAKRKIGKFYVSLAGVVRKVTKKFAGVVMKLKMWVHGAAQKTLTIASTVNWKVHQTAKTIIKSI